MLLATGVTNRRPPMDEELHDEALARGLIRYCPICDGYEVTDKKVGVIGSDSRGVAEAHVPAQLHRRRDADRARQGAGLTPEDQQQAEVCRNIDCVDGPAQAVAITDNCIVVDTAEGHHTFDSVYPALGSDTHTQLAEQIGARLSETGLHRRRCPSADQRRRAFMRRATWWSASTRSAMRWAKAASPRRPSATICAKERPPLLALGRGIRGRATMRPLSEVGDAVAERDQRLAAVRPLDFEQVAGAEILDRDNRADGLRRRRSTHGRPIRSA